MHTGNPAGLRRIAHVDLSAFTANIADLLSRDDSFVLDARANAYGHGAATLIPLALEAGVTSVRVSPDQVGLAGIRRSRLMTIEPTRALAGAEVYGLGAGRPVLTLVGEVVAVKRARAGAGVSYGYTHRVADDTTLALVALGYADGIPRLASNVARVHVAGAPRPLVGRVAMDQFVVDCADDAPAVGEEAVLFGDARAGHPLATEWAEVTSRSALELTAGIGSRVERVYS